MPGFYAFQFDNEVDAELQRQIDRVIDYMYMNYGLEKQDIYERLVTRLDILADYYEDDDEEEEDSKDIFEEEENENKKSSCNDEDDEENNEEKGYL